MRTLGAVAGLLGGLCWVAAYVASGSLLEPLGAVLLVVGCLGIASRLARAPALAAVVAVCATLLAGSLVFLLRDSGDPDVVDAAVGAAAVVVCLVALARRPASRGSHAR